MPAYDQERFTPPPPIRTATSGSQKTYSSGTASPDMLSPTSTYSRGSRSPTSPAEDSFFGAISAKIRGRSRSRSRAGTSRKRSKSPMVLPPQNMPPTRAPHAVAAPTHTTATQRPQQSRHVSSASQSSTASASASAAAAGKPAPSRRSTSSSDPWHGRHSNSWLFNDFSFTETASKAFGRRS